MIDIEAARNRNRGIESGILRQIRQSHIDLINSGGRTSPCDIFDQGTIDRAMDLIHAINDVLKERGEE